MMGGTKLEYSMYSYLCFIWQYAEPSAKVDFLNLSMQDAYDWGVQLLLDNNGTHVPMQSPAELWSHFQGSLQMMSQPLRGSHDN